MESFPRRLQVGGGLDVRGRLGGTNEWAPRAVLGKGGGKRGHARMCFRRSGIEVAEAVRRERGRERGGDAEELSGRVALRGGERRQRHRRSMRRGFAVSVFADPTAASRPQLRLRVDKQVAGGDHPVAFLESIKDFPVLIAGAAELHLALLEAATSLVEIHERLRAG